jgi:uncharacterized protein (DUF58 family)
VTQQVFASRTSESSERLQEGGLRRGAEGLAAAMPRLSADARRASAGVMAGVHGRRRSGQGESFWQFRPFTSGEAAARVDWRRSARDGRLYVREREWEAAQAIWLFIDRSPSMDYRSSLAPVSKEERAIVLGLAAADMLVRGGERVGLIQTTPAISSRRAIERLADAMVASPRFGLAWPTEALAPRSEGLIVSDFLAPLPELDKTLKTLAGRGARGHLLMVSDPAEEAFPFSGQTEFLDPEDGYRLRSGAAEELAATYRLRLDAHREGLRRLANSIGWTLIQHVTEKPASECLLRLSMAVAGEGRS